MPLFKKEMFDFMAISVEYDAFILLTSIVHDEF